jgi:hypothetical protein
MESKLKATFFDEMTKYFSKTICMKIYSEYNNSADYEISSTHSNQNLLSIISKSAKDTTYNVNMITDHCDCDRLIFIGYPCRHLYAAWRYSLKPLVEKTIENTNKHWRIDQATTPSAATSTKNLTVNNTLQSQSILSSQIPSISQIQLNESQKTTIPFHITSQQFKKIKFNDNTTGQLPKLMIIKSNSCRFDTFLAWLFFLTNTDDQDLLKNQDLRCHPFKILNEVVELMNKGNFEDAQMKFLNYCKTSKIDGKITEMGNYFVLIKNLLRDKFIQFQIEYEQTTKCSNNKCSLNSSKNSYVETQDI